MSEILDLSTPPDKNELIIEYRLDEKESTAIESVFNMLFERLIKGE